MRRCVTLTRSDNLVIMVDRVGSPERPPNGKSTRGLDSSACDGERVPAGGPGGADDFRIETWRKVEDVRVRIYSRDQAHMYRLLSPDWRI